MPDIARITNIKSDNKRLQYVVWIECSVCNMSMCVEEGLILGISA